MATKPIKDVAKLATKYTQESTGIWSTIHRYFAVDANRSNGIPVKHFRNPPPAALDPASYDEGVTTPAADIADNPYWRRDVRRAYPKLSTVTQGQAVGLLTLGSAANPSPKLLAGEEGGKQLVAVKQEGEKGLSAYFEQEKAAAVLGENGLPPMPVNFGQKKDVKYEPAPTSYGEEYPCRSFL
ncbi:hypothetical protein H2200_008571 [Cladophialophora chaetospira]|uniref:NADH-ubiquinone oxidoreductase 21.3 kDa subunit n=1 Tax=Cladophialophora chaetospira TaxID=386627 RepID=A0AA39CFF9_9EURO|nr:hypothetical protein H2200_008571 [Cladophialophora chaetospira]